MSCQEEIPKLKEMSIPSEDTAEGYDSAVGNGGVVKNVDFENSAPIEVRHLRPRTRKSYSNSDGHKASLWSVEEVRSLFKAAETCCLVDKVWLHASRWAVVMQHMREDGFNRTLGSVEVKYWNMRKEFRKMKQRKLQGKPPAAYKTMTSSPTLHCHKHGKELYDRMEHFYAVTGLDDGVNVEFDSRKKGVSNARVTNCVGKRLEREKHNQLMTDEEDGEAAHHKEGKEEDVLSDCSSSSEEDSDHNMSHEQFSSSKDDGRRRKMPHQNASKKPAVDKSRTYKAAAKAAPLHDLKLDHNRVPHRTSTRMGNSPDYRHANNKKIMEQKPCNQVLLDHMQSTASHLSEFIEAVKMNIEIVHQVLGKQP